MKMLDRLADLPLVYAIRADGEVIQGHAKSVEFERDLEPFTWSGLRVQVTKASRMTTDFVEHGETLVDFYANDMRVIDRELDRRAVEAREQRLRARLLADRVTIDRLVGRRITKIQGDREVLAFHLADESVWAFRAIDGAWAKHKIPARALSGPVSLVETDHCLRIYVGIGYRDPAVFCQEPDYPEDGFDVSTAFEPSRSWREGAPVIAEA